MGGSVVIPAPSTDPALAPRRPGRVPAFDGMRGVAVLLVVWFHSGLLHVFKWKPAGGFLGVDVFFVLSGFLITSLLLREQTKRRRVRLGAFYRRRVLRLYPAIVVFVIAYLVFTHALHLNVGRARSSIFALLFYYTNWKSIYWPPLGIAFGHLWSLAIEEQFYLVWPLVIGVLGIRARLRTVVIVLVTTIAAIVIWRLYLYESGASWSRSFTGTDTRADGLLIGALLAHIWMRGKVPRRGIVTAAWIAAAFLVLCVFRCSVMGSFLYVGGFTLVAIATAIVLLAILESDWSGTRVLQMRPLRAVGRVSYGLYIWHPLVFFWVWWCTRHWNRWPRLTMAIAVLTVVTYASWKLVEQPFLRWKDRLETVDAAAEAEVG